MGRRTRLILALGVASMMLAGCQSFDIFGEKKTPVPGERRAVFSQQELQAMELRGRPPQADTAAPTR